MSAYFKVRMLQVLQTLKLDSAALFEIRMCTRDSLFKWHQVNSEQSTSNTARGYYPDLECALSL